MSLPHEKPADIHGHTWEFIPYAKGMNVGSFRCSKCLGSYEMGDTRFVQCDNGESFRKDVKKSIQKCPPPNSTPEPS
jgi:hypothetical protein